MVLSERNLVAQAFQPVKSVRNDIVPRDDEPSMPNIALARWGAHLEIPTETSLPVGLRHWGASRAPSRSETQ